MQKRYRERIALGESGNTLILLIAICLIMFVLLAFMRALSYFNYPPDTALGYYHKNVLSWFVMPASFSALLSRPWTVITHMFVHDDIWKIFSNMLWLWCFGFILQDITGTKKIIPVFIYGSLGGAIAFLLAYNFLPSLQPFSGTATALGAASGVMAIAAVTTMVSPGYRIFPMLNGGIPLWVLTVIYVVADLATVSISDTGGLITHMAGAITGILFMYFLRMGYDWSRWMNNLFDWFGNLFNPDKPKKGQKPIREELFYKSSKVVPFTKTPHVTQQRIDEILDKISQKGYGSLSKEEKDLLERAGKDGL